MFKLLSKVRTTASCTRRTEHHVSTVTYFAVSELSTFDDMRLFGFAGLSFCFATSEINNVPDWYVIVHRVSLEIVFGSRGRCCLLLIEIKGVLSFPLHQHNTGHNAIRQIHVKQGLQILIYHWFDPWIYRWIYMYIGMYNLYGYTTVYTVVANDLRTTNLFN